MIPCVYTLRPNRSFPGRIVKLAAYEPAVAARWTADGLMTDRDLNREPRYVRPGGSEKTLPRRGVGLIIWRSHSLAKLGGTWRATRSTTIWLGARRGSVIDARCRNARESVSSARRRSLQRRPTTHTGTLAARPRSAPQSKVPPFDIAAYTHFQAATFGAAGKTFTL